MNNADIGARLRGAVKELGTCTIELIKATGTCQVSPHDSFALRDVSENARSVGEKVNEILLKFMIVKRDKEFCGTRIFLLESNFFLFCLEILH